MRDPPRSRCAASGARSSRESVASRGTGRRKGGCCVIANRLRLSASPHIHAPMRSRTRLREPSAPTRYWQRTSSRSPLRASRTRAVTPVSRAAVEQAEAAPLLKDADPDFKYYFCLHANETMLRLEQTPTLVHVGNGESVQVELMPSKIGAKARSVVAFEAVQDLSPNYQAYPATDCGMLNATVAGTACRSFTRYDYRNSATGAVVFAATWWLPPGGQAVFAAVQRQAGLVVPHLCRLLVGVDHRAGRLLGPEGVGVLNGDGGGVAEVVHAGHRG